MVSWRSFPNYLIFRNSYRNVFIQITRGVYCAFHKHANSKVQKPPSQLRFPLPSIIITITSNEPWNTETHKTDRNPPIANQKPWPFEPVNVKLALELQNLHVCKKRSKGGIDSTLCFVSENKVHWSFLLRHSRRSWWQLVTITTDKYC